jgi:Icc-related predicted phosphoesterase
MWIAAGGDLRFAPATKFASLLLVIHAHAHEGTAHGRVGEIPVLNVSAQVLGRPLVLVDLP